MTQSTPRQALTQKQERARERWVRLQAYLVAGDPTFLEWLLGGLKTGWGLWLLLSPHSFAAAPHLYRFVAALPEWDWGMLMVVLGTSQLLAWHHQWQRVRLFASVGAVILWERLGWLTWLADHRAVTLLFLSILSLAQILAATLLYGKAFPSEADRRLGYDKV